MLLSNMLDKRDKRLNKIKYLNSRSLKSSSENETIVTSYTMLFSLQSTVAYCKFTALSFPYDQTTEAINKIQTAVEVQKKDSL